MAAALSTLTYNTRMLPMVLPVPVPAVWACAVRCGAGCWLAG